MDHIFEYLEDDRLLDSPMNILTRILVKFFNDKENPTNDNQRIKMIDFIIKFSKEKKFLSSVIFTSIKFKNEEIIYLINEMVNYSYVFNNEFVKSTLFQSLNFIQK